MRDNVKLCLWAIRGFDEWEETAQEVLAATYCNNEKWVRETELVFIERGLAEAYGRELQEQLWPPREHVTCIIPPSFEAYIAAAATAPLSVRIRAMCAVIDAQEAK